MDRKRPGRERPSLTASMGELALTDLERRVVAKFRRSAAGRPLWHFDPGEWVPDGYRAEPDVRPAQGAVGAVQSPMRSLPPDAIPEVPRQQWANCPDRRRLALMACDIVLDRAGTMTDEEWMRVCLTMQYGGKIQVDYVV